MSQFVDWLVTQRAARLAYATPTSPRGAPQLASRRIEAIERTYQVALQHADFKKIAASGDNSRDMKEFAQAERQYGQALRILPLHGGYRVQYAHCLKEQNKDSEAFIQYWYALGLGAPQHDVEEHVLFAAGRAGIGADASDVSRRAAAFANAQRTKDDWDVAPIEEDFLDFAGLFWGDKGLVNSAFVIPHLLTCHTRKALFIRFLSAPDTLRLNRSLFVMLNQKGLPDV